jgi:hypothetical protein
LGWKIKFIGAAIVMFLAYSAIAPLIDHSGWRAPRMIETRDPDAERDCHAKDISMEARAACIVARDDARDAKWKARREMEAAEYAKRRAEEKALEEEVTRQRAAAKSKQLRAEYERRIDAITTGQKHFANYTEKTAHLEETLRVLVQLLAATEGHPAKALDRRIQRLNPADALAVINMEGKEMPSAEARAEADRICGARTASGWRDRCADLLKRHVLKLPVGITRYYLNAVTNAAPVAGGK